MSRHFGLTRQGFDGMFMKHNKNNLGRRRAVSQWRQAMTTQEIAQKLCDHCRKHTEARGLEELYADDARSVEPMAYGDQGQA